MIDLLNLIDRFRKFEAEAHQILASVESSRQSRTINLSETTSRVAKMTRKQRELLLQSLRCCELGLYRASHVMAWSALIDRVQEILSLDNFVKINAAYPKWKINDMYDLREKNTEYVTVQAANRIGVLTKSEMKALHGLLSKRNECAHPSDFYPDLNQSLGYISEIILRFEKLDRH